MADLIDRQQALALRFTHAINEDGVVYVQYREYQNGIVRLPSANCQQVTGKLDCISRQAAIEALKNRWKKSRNYEGIGDDIAEECELYLKQLPPAQPEIIRCKDCIHQEKFFHEDKRRKNGGHYIYGCELADGYSHVCLDDDYCSRGERRTDDADVNTR